MGKHLAADVEGMFADMAAESAEELWIRTCIDRDTDRNRLVELRADVKADPVKAMHRRRAQCQYVAARERIDPKYRMNRRERSRQYARELTQSREAAKVDLFFERACPLPCMVVGRDIPEPRAARLKPRVDEKRRRHAEQEQERRRRAKRVDSMPLFERGVA